MGQLFQKLASPLVTSKFLTLHLVLLNYMVPSKFGAMEVLVILKNGLREILAKSLEVLIVEILMVMETTS